MYRICVVCGVKICCRYDRKAENEVSDAGHEIVAHQFYPRPSGVCQNNDGSVVLCAFYQCRYVRGYCRAGEFHLIGSTDEVTEYANMNATLS